VDEYCWSKEQGARATRSSVATIISFSLFFEVSEAMYLNPRIVGSGERTLVLSHGYGGSQAIWDMVLPHLARRNKVRSIYLAAYCKLNWSRSDLCMHASTM